LAAFTEPLFMDDRHAHLSGQHGRRLVPGALLFSLAEGLIMMTNVLRHTAIAFLGASMTMKAPVFVGDTIEVEATVIERRLTSSGDRGLVRTQNIVRRGDEPVMHYSPLRMARCGSTAG
jgi:acyl dehydratase